MGIKKTRPNDDLHLYYYSYYTFLSAHLLFITIASVSGLATALLSISPLSEHKHSSAYSMGESEVCEIHPDNIRADNNQLTLPVKETKKNKKDSNKREQKLQHSLPSSRSSSLESLSSSSCCKRGMVIEALLSGALALPSRPLIKSSLEAALPCCASLAGETSFSMTVASLPCSCNGDVAGEAEPSLS